MEYPACCGMRKNAANCVRQGQKGRMHAYFCIFEDNNRDQKGLYKLEKVFLPAMATECDMFDDHPSGLNKTFDEGIIMEGRFLCPPLFKN